MERGGEYSVNDPAWRIEAKRLVARGLHPHGNKEAMIMMPLSMKQLRVRQRAPDVRRVSARPPPAAFMDNRLAVKETKQKGRRLEVIDFTKAETFQKLKEENESKVKQLTGSGRSDDTAEGLAGEANTTNTRNLRREELEYESERGMGKHDRVPLLCLSQQSSTKKPALILIHDLGQNMYDFLERMETFARSGYFCCAIDCRHHGGRAQSPRALHNALRKALIRPAAAAESSSLFCDSAFDVIALMDYLCECRPDVDPTRMGILGIGTGGDIALIASAIDRRVRATAALPRIFSMSSIIDQGEWKHFVQNLKYQSLTYMGHDLLGMPSAQEEALFDILQENRPELVHRAGEENGEAESDWKEKLKDCLNRLSEGITTHFDGKMTIAQIVPRPLCLLVEEDKSYIAEEAKKSIQSLPDNLKGDLQVHCITTSDRSKQLRNVDSLVDAFFSKHFLPQKKASNEKSSNGSSSVVTLSAGEGLEERSPLQAKYGAFVACPVFCGKREGYIYEDGNHGLGYYFAGGALQNT